jgi:hypothetical protein
MVPTTAALAVIAAAVAAQSETKVIHTFEDPGFAFVFTQDCAKVAYSTGTELVVRSVASGEELYRSELAAPTGLLWLQRPERRPLCWGLDGTQLVYWDMWKGEDAEGRLDRHSCGSVLTVKSGQHRALWDGRAPELLLDGWVLFAEYVGGSNKQNLLLGSPTEATKTLIGRIDRLAGFDHPDFDSPDVPAHSWMGLRRAGVSPNGKLAGTVLILGGNKGAEEDALVLFDWDGKRVERTRIIKPAYEFAISPDSKRIAYIVVSLAPNDIGRATMYTLERLTLFVATPVGTPRKVAQWEGSQDEELCWADVHWDASGEWVATLATPFDAENRLRQGPKPQTWHFTRVSDGLTFDAAFPGLLVTFPSNGPGALKVKSLTSDYEKGKIQVLETTIPIPTGR